MLWLRHRLACEEFDARHTQQALRTPDLVIYRNRFENAAFDDAMAPAPTRGDSWSRICVVLEGEVLVRRGRGEIVLRAGGLSVSPTWEQLRSLTATSDHLVISWRVPGPIAPRAESNALVCMPQSTKDALVRLAVALAGTEPRELQSATATARATLASLGLGFDEAACHAALRSVRPSEQAFGMALQSILFPLSGRPMITDLCRVLALSERHVLRLARDYFKRFHVSVDSWGDYVHVIRMAMGVALCSHPAARTESVSRALGYSSPTALCHAFQTAGIQSPQEVRRQIGPLNRRTLSLSPELAVATAG